MEFEIIEVAESGKYKIISVKYIPEGATEPNISSFSIPTDKVNDEEIKKGLKVFVENIPPKEPTPIEDDLIGKKFKVEKDLK